jgi:hypothetical protein
MDSVTESSCLPLVPKRENLHRASSGARGWLRSNRYSQRIAPPSRWSPTGLESPRQFPLCFSPPFPAKLFP